MKDADTSAEPAATRHRLHNSSLIFELFSQARQQILPAIIATFGAAQGNRWWLYGGLFAVTIAMIGSILRFITLRYRIDADELTVTSGLLFRSTRTVPINRIQNIDTVQSPLHRHLNVAEVRVETASGAKPEAVLRVLSLDQIDALRQAVSRLQTTTTGRVAVGSEPALDGDHHATDETLLTIPTSWLVRAGLSSTRGFIFVGMGLGALYQTPFYNKMGDLNLPQADAPSLVPAAVSMIVAIVVLLFLLSVGWHIFRFAGYRLSLREDDLHVECGLFTRVNATIPRRRIQLISVHRPLLVRAMGFASIRIETAGGSANSGGDIGRRWFVPIVPESEVGRILTSVRPGFSTDDPGIDWRTLSRYASRRRMRKQVLPFLGTLLFGFALARHWGLIAGLAALPLLLWWAVARTRATRYARTDDGVLYASGVWNRKLSATFFDKIQVLETRQSPFDRRWNMATLAIDTAGAGPAGHSIRVAYLDEAIADEELVHLRAEAARHPPEWR